MMMLGYIGIAVEDVAETGKFLQEIIGLELGGECGGVQAFHNDAGAPCVYLHEGPENDLTYMGWQVDSAESLEAVRDRVGANGIEIAPASETERAQRGVHEMFRLSDPDGLVNEIYYGPQVQSGRTFRSPRDIDGFVTGDKGLGHLALAVGNAEATSKFYRDVLGFDISDYINVPMGAEQLSIPFLHCNSRHHSLALVAMPHEKNLLHVMMEMRSMADVGKTLDIARRNAVPVSAELGCHSNDRVVSFYLDSPAGFEFEIGHGGVSIGPDWVVRQHDRIYIWGGQKPGEVAS